MDPNHILHLPSAPKPHAGEGPSLRPLAQSLPAPAAQPLATMAPRRPHTRWIAIAAALSCVVAAGALAHAASRHQPTVARHVGAPAIKSTSTGAPIRWRSGEIVVTLDPTLDALGPTSKDAVRAAMGTWLAESPQLPNVVFENASSPGAAVAHDGVSRVSAGPIDIPGHQNDLGVTVTWSSDESGSIIEVDTIFNTKHHFGSAGSERDDDEGHGEHGSGHSCDGFYDLQNVATHELGHFFGLGEDPTEAQATMFVESHECETLKRDLFTTDISAMGGLYDGSGPDAADSMPSSAGCAVAAGAPSHASALIPLAVALGWLAIARRKRC